MGLNKCDEITSKCRIKMPAVLGVKSLPQACLVTDDKEASLRDEPAEKFITIKSELLHHVGGNQTVGFNS